MFTVPNGQIVKSLNLSNDWARAVVDIPVPASSDLNRVNDVLKAPRAPGAHGRGRRGRTLTSYPSLRIDLRNAGANAVDQEVVVDGKLISSRSPEDLTAFCATVVAEFAKTP